MKIFRYLSLLLIILLSACNFSLAEDITPPPGYESDILLSESTIKYPEDPSSPKRGAELYGRDCSACHGETGLGNGPMASSMPVSVTAIGLGVIRNQASPSGWLDAITTGNPERGMPSYSNYSTQESWDLLSYLFTMEASADSLREGEQLYISNCVECHGIAGDGVTGVDFNNLESMAQVTNTSLFRSISDGIGSMPPFAGKLSEPEMWKITDYLRSKAFDMSGIDAYATVAPTGTEIAASEAVPSPMSTQTLEPTITGILENEFGTITGMVINDSSAMVAGSVLATLISFSHTDGQIVDSRTTPIQEDGSFSFTNITLDPQITYWISVDYQGVTYFSDAVVFDSSSEITGVSIAVYDSTSNWTTLSFDLVHISLAVADDVIQVSELYIIRNPGLTTITIETDGSVLPFITLPQGVSQFISLAPDSSSAPFLPASGGIALPPSPDVEYGIVATFSLPYQRELDFSQEFNLLIKSLTLFAPEGIKIKSDQLTDAGVEDFGGTSFHLYEGTNITPGYLELVISGKPKGSGGDSETRTIVVFGAAILGFIFIGLGVFLFWRDRKVSEIEDSTIDNIPQIGSLPQSMEEILDSILVLDDEYKNGKLSSDDYRIRRKELMQKIKKSPEN